MFMSVLTVKVTQINYYQILMNIISIFELINFMKPPFNLKIHNTSF